MKKILFLTNFRWIIPQRISHQEWLNLKLIVDILKNKWFYSEIKSFSEINNDLSIIKNFDFVISSSAQDILYKSYIIDLLFYINNIWIKIIPELKYYISHENKVFQVLENQNNNVWLIKSRIISSYSEWIQLSDSIKYPVILKNFIWYWSKSVNIIRNKKDLQKYLRQHFTFYSNKSKLIWYWKNLIKKIINSKYQKDELVWKIVLQEYIEWLEWDWKIVFFGNKISWLYRKVRKNDFRASWSWLFDFIEVPSDILNYVIKIKNSLNIPWGSLDIAKKDWKLYLIEYQVVHFWLTTPLKCKFHYEFKNNKFIKVEWNINVDNEIANCIMDLLNKAN